MAREVRLDLGDDAARALNSACARTGGFSCCLLLSAVVLLVGCATAPTKRPSQSPPDPPRAGPPSAQFEEGAAKLRQDLEQLTRGVDRTAGRSEDLQRAVARLGTQVEALERRIESLVAVVAQARASRPPSTVGGEAASSAARLLPRRSAEELYEAALGRYRAKDLDGAILLLYEFQVTYPDHALRERARFQIAEILYAQRDYRAALLEYQDFLREFPRGEFSPDAWVKVGLSHRAFGDATNARAAWQRVVRQYPNTEAAKQAAELLRRNRSK